MIRPPQCCQPRQQIRQEARFSMQSLASMLRHLALVCVAVAAPILLLSQTPLAQVAENWLLAHLRSLAHQAGPTGRPKASPGKSSQTGTEALDDTTLAYQAPPRRPFSETWPPDAPRASAGDQPEGWPRALTRETASPAVLSANSRGATALSHPSQWSRASAFPSPVAAIPVTHLANDGSQAVSPLVPLNDQERAAAIPTSSNQFAENSAGKSAGELSRRFERLRELGANYYLLETWGEDSGLFRFHCKMAVGGEHRQSRHFEATAADPLVAVDTVLAQVESWRFPAGN